MTKKSKYDMPPVQNFAFGGIANPSQRAFLRSSDKSYLDARQKELDAFEQQRLAYNDSLTKWQTDVYNPYKAQVDAYNAASEKYNTDVYNPYKAQVDAYNAAAEKYNTDVYNPYKTQFQKYQEAVEAYNAGDRLTDYAGPAEPKLASEFGMTAPTAPKAFEMAAPTTPGEFKGVAPTLPFKEEEVQAYQQSAADRARKDAGQRAVAIDVVSNPDQFNFGSMSVANRFMAKGGEVMEDDSHDRTAASVIKDFEGYGYTKEEIMELADKVAAAGRGGDELLAYLSPESVEYLKSHGGSGTINPVTGLPEFKGGVLGKIGRAVKRVFGGGGGSAAPAAPVEDGQSLQAQRRAARLDAESDEVQRPQQVLQRRTTAAEDLKTVAPPPTPTPAPVTTTPPPVAVTPPPVAVTPPPAVAPPVASTPAPPTITPAAPATTPGTAASMLKNVNAATSSTPAPQPASPTMTPPPEQKLMTPPPLAPAPTPAAPTTGVITAPPKSATPTLSTAIDQLKAGDKETATNTLRQIVGLDPIPVKPKTQITAPGMVGGPVGSRTVTGGPVDRFVALPAPSFTAVGAANPLGKVNLGGRIGSPVVGRPGGGGGSQPSPQSPVVPTDSIGHFGIDEYGRRAGDPDFGKQSPTMPRMSDGPGYGGGSIPIFGPAVPSGPMFGNPNARVGGAATSPSSYFGLSPQTSTGLAPGSAAIGPADMPIAAGQNTLNAIGANPNLSPTMLGGQQNAGIMRDRLGNQIYAPGAGLFGPPRFAKGGDVSMSDILAMNTETLSDEQPEEVINTNPVGTAQKMLADLSGAGKPSPTRQSIKRVKTSGGGGATADKGMKMSYEDLAQGDLGAMKDVTPSARNTDSARAQMEELARVYQMKIRAAQNKGRGLMADTLGAPTLEGPTLTKGSLTKKRFKDGGEAKKDSAEKVESRGFFSDLFKGSDDDFIQSIKNKAEQNSDYRSMLEFLKSRDAVPDIKTGYLPYGTDAVFSTTKLPIGSGTIKISKDIVGSDYKGDVGPSTLAHEMAHATDRQLEQQASEQSGIFKKGNKFTDAYQKLVGPGGMRSGEKRTELARKAYPKWASETKDYRSTPYEIAAHGVGNYAGPTTSDRAPPHVDATAATEFQILLDLARRNSGAPVKRADGSPEEGEIGPAFVTPKSGKGRKEGEISRQLRSGDAYVNMAKGVTELPYDIAGAPVDLATMLMRPFGYSTEKPVMGSDFIKEKMTKAGVRPEPPADPTAKGFYTAGEMLSNLTNPAGVTRSAVKGAKKTGEAATAVAKDFQEYNRQLAVPGASYAVRPSGSTIMSGPIGMQEDVSGIDKLLKSGLSNATMAAGQNDGQALILRDFWDKKARNYFTRQFGTPDDPIARGIATKQIRGSALEESFPEYMIDQIAAGKTRVKEGVRPEGFVGPGTPETRFFPKYPRAMDDFTKRYDEATTLKGNLITSDPAAARPEFSSLLSEQGKQLARTAQVSEEDKMIAQGLRPELINANVGTVTRSPSDYDKVIGDGTPSADSLFKAYKEAGLMKKMDAPEKTSWINQLFGEGRKIMGKTEDEVVQNMLPENIMTAINRGEPVYDIGYGLQKPLQTVFDPVSINKYLASIPPREAANIRFEDAIKGALKMREQDDQRKLLVERIKSGKPVADAVFAKGVSAPLLQFEEGPYKGFAWKRIEDRAATVPEGAYVGHSVGGYETGGAGYSTEKREGFGTGKWQVYTLRDNRNRPVNTIEVKMLDEFTPVVTQIKGNGRASGNVPAEKYDSAVLQFLQNYLRPAAVQEKDELLTPLLKTYKEGVNSTFKMP